jgi:hypothetical protein
MSTRASSPPKSALGAETAVPKQRSWRNALKHFTRWTIPLQRAAPTSPVSTSVPPGGSASITETSRSA